MKEKICTFIYVYIFEDSTDFFQTGLVAQYYKI